MNYQTNSDVFQFSLRASHGRETPVMNQRNSPPLPLGFLSEELRYETGVCNPCRTLGTIDRISKRSTDLPEP
ncbi:MAG: hypothetical protein HC894_03235 [Microcoleus sp. SM1_3_4]|nr:hypothetical protein [Microcoleus sp. SM1_3_4]